MTFEQAQAADKCSLCGQPRPEKPKGWVVDTRGVDKCLLICGDCRGVSISDELFEEARVAG